MLQGQALTLLSSYSRPGCALLLAILKTSSLVFLPHLLITLITTQYQKFKYSFSLFIDWLRTAKLTLEQFPRSVGLVIKTLHPSITLPFSREKPNSIPPDLLRFFNQFSTMMQPKKDIVVAVDFGTTFSGVAWAQTSNVSE